MNLFDKVKLWVLNNRLETTLLIIVILIGAYFRLYRISEYMIFLGDEGRDAIIVRRLLVNFDPVLIGPGTSIGNMYLGPLYYYMMAPALLLAAFNPVGPAIMIALLGTITIYFVWYVVRLWFPNLKGINKGALIAAFLYAISPVVINFSKSSWNPNIMPFFSLLTVFSVWKFWKEEKFGWIIVTFISMAFVLQSHYLGLLLVPLIVFFWILNLANSDRRPITDNSKLKTENRKPKTGIFLKYSLLGLCLFLVLMSPLAIFDLRHNFMNYNAVKVFFTQRQTTVSALPWKAIPNLPLVFSDSISSLLGAKNVDLTWLFANGIWIFTLWILISELFSKTKIKTNEKEFWQNVWKKISGKEISPYFILIIWLLTSYIGLGLYKQHIYDHYYGFFFTAPFILVGGITGYILKNFNKNLKIILTAFFIYAVVVNFAANPLKYPPNRQMQRAIKVAEQIKEVSGSKRYNLAVVAERNYEDGYQYFLEKWGEPVYDIDPLDFENTLGENLFVVCEMPKDKCDPVHSPKTEIANFGWSRIDGEWDVFGVTLYKLIHAN